MFDRNLATMNKKTIPVSALLGLMLLILGLNLATTTESRSSVAEWNPDSVNCYNDSNDIVSLGAECIVVYSSCVENRCPKGTHSNEK